MIIKKIEDEFSICQVSDFSMIKFEKKYCFTQKTIDENSLVCLTSDVPSNVVKQDDGWKGFYIDGVLDFSLIGVLAKIATTLSENDISIFALSTYNTDYILVKKADYDRALSILATKGYKIED